MTWRWIMMIFGKTDHECSPQIETLRKLEERERVAVDRVVDAGVRATMEASKSSEKADAVTNRLIKREKDETDKAILTADRLLRFLEGKPP